MAERCERHWWSVAGNESRRSPTRLLLALGAARLLCYDRSLGELPPFAPYGFVRIHKKLAVNLDRIREIHRNFVEIRVAELRCSDPWLLRFSRKNTSLAAGSA